MSKLNDLITKLCPHGVQYKKLGEVLNYEQPSKYLVSSKNYSDEYSTPVLTAGKTFILGYTDEINGIYQASKDNPVIIFDDFTTDFKWVDFPFKAKSSGMKMLTPIDSNMCCFRYIYYAMSVINFVPSEHKRHWISQYSNFTIPVPPLPVQEEVVRILDSFTTLEAELEAELDDRKEQYEYYRDYLLDKNTLEKIDGTAVETKKLGEVCHYVKNKVDMADVLPENYTSVENLIKNCGGRMNAISIPKDGKCTDVMIGDILLGNIRPNLRKAWLATCAGGASNDVLVIRIKDGVNLNARYLYQIIAGNDFSCYNIQHMRGAKMPRGDKSKILDYKLPVPSLATQERVVDILDRFDALTTSLTDGIPAEIAMRREQYEYCRSRLLDFPRLPDDTASVSDSE